jgi:cytidylate kinase
MAKITIFGLAGTGTSSIGKKLAADLNYQFLSSGQIFRKKAEELGMDLYTFDEMVITNPQYDIDLDKQIEEYGKTNNDFVVESRLAWHFIPDSFKVKLICDFEERVKRVATRDKVAFEYARDKTVKREAEGEERYAKVYGITEFAKDKNFDLIIDSTQTPIPEIIEIIIKKLKVDKII